jgi:hypothetical protein
MAALTCRKCCDSTHISEGYWSTIVVSRVQSYAVLVGLCQLLTTGPSPVPALPPIAPRSRAAS